MERSFVKVASVGDIAGGELRLVSAGGAEIVVARVGDDFWAFEAICTHAFGMLDEGELVGHEVVCPIHEGRFDIRTGRATHPPAIKPLVTYDVRVEGDDILVGPPRPLWRP